MESPDRKKWVRLRFVFKEGKGRIEYEDGIGNRTSADQAMTYVPAPGGSTILVPSTLRDNIRKVIEAEPRQRATRKGFMNIPVAVYVDMPWHGPFFWHPEQSDDMLQRLIETILGVEEMSELQIVYHSESTPQEEMDLPVKFRSFRNDALNQFRDEYWYKNNPHLGEYGLSIESTAVFIFREEFLQFNSETDILVLHSWEAVDYLERARTENCLPRFLIILEYHTPISTLLSFKVPFLMVDHHWHSHENIGLFLREFFMNVVHDYPLHEALFDARRQFPSPLRPFLFASQESNQVLRLSGALAKFQEKVSKYANILNPGDTIAFMQKIRQKKSTETANKIGTAFENIFKKQQDLGYDRDMSSFFKDSKFLGMHFQGEGTGLIPLSSANKVFKNNEPALENIQQELKSLVSDKDVFDSIRETQERKVDITLDEFGDSLVYLPTQSKYSLRPGKRYRLNVSIGQVSDHNLIIEDTPPLDPLLPDPEDGNGHELDVVVFGKDFILQSEPLQKIYLPLLGGSSMARFEVDTPTDSGNAEMRIVIFFKNHLLQSFLLDAVISPDFNYDGNNKLKVSLELSASERFTNLAELPDRDLYIGINSDQNGHSMFLKGDSSSNEIKGLTEALIKTAQDTFCELLQSAYFDKGKPKFSSQRQPGDGVQSAAFIADVTKMARFGRKLYRHLAEASVDTPMWDILSGLRQKTDSKIQIARYDLKLSFPWNIIYDGNIPADDVPGKYPVCLGKTFSAPDLAGYKLVHEKGKGCRHNPDIRTYCIEGFWGVRNHIEQIVPGMRRTNAVQSVKGSQTTDILYAHNVVDQFTTDLEVTKLPALKKKLKVYEPVQPLIEVLWDFQNRPAALILVGHLETKDHAEEPNGARIIPFPKNSWGNPGSIPLNMWIYHDLIFEHCQDNQRWQEDPLPIIFLMNCSVAMIKLASIESIVSGFSTAGAAAIVATECDLTTGLATRFVGEVMKSLYVDHQTLGEAIQTFNRRLMQSGIPLPFAFTCFGNIDLKLDT